MSKNAVFLHTESDDDESCDRLGNKTLNDESTPLAMLYTERMVSGRTISATITFIILCEHKML